MSAEVEVVKECQQNLSVLAGAGLATPATERVWDDKLGTNIIEQLCKNEHRLGLFVPVFVPVDETNVKAPLLREPFVRPSFSSSATSG